VDFRFRLNERFLYEYDFRDSWQHQIRLEAVRPAQAGKVYPMCIAGSGAAPPEDCKGPWAYMEIMDHQELELPWDDVKRIDHVLKRVVDTKDHEKASDVLGDVEALQEAIERVKAYLEFRPDRFQRGPVRPGKTGCYAAFLTTSSEFCIPGYQTMNFVRKSPFRVWVRICSSR
jgi:hypothetical protein